MKRFLVLARFLLAVLPAQVLEDSPRLGSLIRGGNLYLSLQDAIAIALENNLDVELQRFGPRFAETDIKRTSSGALPRGVPLSVREGPKSASASVDALAPVLGPGAETNVSIAGQVPLTSGIAPPSLDPVLTGEALRSHATAPQANSFAVGVPVLMTDTSAWNFGWQKGFLSGATLAAGFENSRQSLNHLRYDLAPYNASSFGVTFTQPLLRGFGISLNSRFIRIAKNNSRQSDLVFQQQAISTVAAVIRLYWDLVGLNEDVRVRREALRQAEKLLSDNEEQVDAGTRAPIEVVRARAEVARSRRDLIAAESLVLQQEVVFKDYLSRKTVSDPSLASVRIIPTDPFHVNPNEILPSAGELAATAFRDRPDIDQARIQIQSTQLALQGGKDALRPSLDLVASARNNGLAGDVNPLTLVDGTVHTPDPALVGGYGAALSQLFRRSYPDYGVGIQVTIPLKNRAAEADYTRDSLALRQQEVRLLQLRKQVQSLAAEEEKLAVGASTTFLVIQYQRDLAQARSAEVAARAGFVKARAVLHRAAGTLLDAYGVSVVGTDVRFR
jgi:outer membrane protein